jgi:hypothetical protein
MKINITIFLTIIFLSLNGFSQQAPQVIIPKFADKYCEFVKKLESGQTDIDYQEFRYSFIESEQFIISNKKSTEFNKLKEEMYNQMNKSNYSEIIKITKAMLSIDYTSMIAHKILRQTYKTIGDTVNAAKYKAIQFGLMKSIGEKGNGKTCSTAWPVIQIEEEYFFLDVMGAKLLKQSIDNEGGICDKMVVIVDGIEKTYYFETSKIFEGYKKLGLD